MLGGALPAAGTTCVQDAPFQQPDPTSDYLVPSLKADDSLAVSKFAGRARVSAQHGKPLVLAP
jgi:hypothetical protein